MPDPNTTLSQTEKEGASGTLQGQLEEAIERDTLNQTKFSFQSGSTHGKGLQESNNKIVVVGRAKKGKNSGQTWKKKKKSRQSSNAVPLEPNVKENKGKRKGAKRESEGDVRTHKKGRLVDDSVPKNYVSPMMAVYQPHQSQ
jgi:hypothetical protein